MIKTIFNIYSIKLNCVYIIDSFTINYKDMIYIDKTDDMHLVIDNY